jgi:hypothetical protein
MPLRDENKIAAPVASRTRLEPVVINNHSESTPAAVAKIRGTNDGPWCWQNKAALRLIRQAFDNHSFLADALAVYLTFTEIASDEQSQTFTKRRRAIAERSGISLRQFDRILTIFVSVGLIHRQQNFIPDTKELAENTYTLCPVCATQRKAGTRLRRPQKCALGAVNKESTEESPKRLNDAKGVSIKQTNKQIKLSAHRLNALERSLMGRLRQLLGEGEMNRAGGHWRVDWVRPHGHLVGRALNELESQIKEGNDKDNRAAWLEDLLKRWINPKP